MNNMWMYLLPVIIGVAAALFSEEIDKALNGNKEVLRLK